jgi:hypothetical protein
MSSLKAEGDGWQRSVQGTSSSGVPQPRPVFPDYICVNLEHFQRAANPLWEPDRPSTSSLYKARVNTQGRIFCTRRMQRWLHSLPDQNGLRPEPLSPGRQPSLAEPHENIRPRAQSAPASGPAAATGAEPGNHVSASSLRFGHPNPLSQHPIQLEHRHSTLRKAPLQLETPPPLEEVSSRPEGQTKLEVTIPPQLKVHCHTQEVPLLFEDWDFQPRIPQRRSSLYFGSQLASHAQQSHHPPSAFDDIFQGLSKDEIDQERTSGSEQSQERGGMNGNGSNPSQPKGEADTRIINRPASKRHTIHFGSNPGDKKQQPPSGSPEKDIRAQVSSPLAPYLAHKSWIDAKNLMTIGGVYQSVALTDGDEPEKRPKSLFGSIRSRNRRSVLGTPVADLDNGRKSSASVMLRDMRRSSKELISKLAVRKKGIEPKWRPQTPQNL